MRSESDGSSGELLSRLLDETGIAPLSPSQQRSFQAYLSLFVRWNSKTNLSSVRQPEDILSRHFIESIACARFLPAGIFTLVDFGSGGGLPGIPISICRPEITVTLAESQGKKAAFLQEAVRTLGITAEVFAGRAEKLAGRFDCVILRAVDRMADAVQMAIPLVNTTGWLVLMTTHTDAPALQRSAGHGFEWQPDKPLPLSQDRILSFAKKTS